MVDSGQGQDIFDHCRREVRLSVALVARMYGDPEPSYTANLELLV